MGLETWPGPRFLDFITSKTLINSRDCSEIDCGAQCISECKAALCRMEIVLLTLCWPIYWASCLTVALCLSASLRKWWLNIISALGWWVSAQYKVTCVGILALLEWMLWLLNCSRIPVSWYVPPGSEEGWCCFPRKELHLYLDCPWRSQSNWWWPKLLDLDLSLSYWCTKGHCIWINWAFTYM